MSERLVRVERFDELRVGIIVVIKPCPMCGRTHRGMIASENTDEALGMDGDSIEEAGVPTVQVLPVPTCVTVTPNACTRKDRFRPGAVYRVLDDLESPAETAAASLGSETTRRTKETADVH